MILQKFWVLNEQPQAIGRIVRLRQQRTPTAWVVHCAGSDDDRAQELHESRAIYEARIMHGLIGESFSYQDLLNISKKVKKLVLPSGALWTTVDHCGPP